MSISDQRFVYSLTHLRIGRSYLFSLFCVFLLFRYLPISKPISLPIFKSFFFQCSSYKFLYKMVLKSFRATEKHVVEHGIKSAKSKAVRPLPCFPDTCALWPSLQQSSRPQFRVQSLRPWRLLCCASCLSTSQKRQAPSLSVGHEIFMCFVLLELLAQLSGVMCQKKMILGIMSAAKE